MKRACSVVLIALLMIPSQAFAWGPRRPRTIVVNWTVVVRRGFDGGAIAAGVLGGLATGIILDRVLVSYPPQQPVYYPPPPRPAPRDPYDEGYSEGYSQGIERGRHERYD